MSRCVPSLESAVLTAFVCASGVGHAQEVIDDTWTTEEVRSVDDCAPDDDSCTHTRFRYPVFVGDGPVVGALNEAVDDLLSAPLLLEDRATPAELTREMFAEYRAFRAEFPTAEVPWSVERVVTVAHHDDAVVSLRLDEYTYLGGAHPNSAATYRVISLRDGHDLELADVLVDEYLGPLTRLGEAAFRASRGIGPGESLQELGFWFEGGEFALNTNFAIVAEGIAFRFDPYEVVAYAFGPTDFVVRWPRVRELLRPEYADWGKAPAS